MVALLALVGLLQGCGRSEEVPANRSSVSGMVTLDGEPLPGGSISFILKSDPNYNVRVNIREGKYDSNRTPIGPCSVTVETDSLLHGNPSAHRKIPAEYEVPTTSGFEADLKPGENEDVNFDLKSGGPAG